MELWGLWRRAYEQTSAAVIGEVTDAVDLTDSEIAVLLRLEHGPVRHCALAEELGWHRSRLSHQVTRMMARGLVIRSGSAARTEVALTDRGRARLLAARPVHAEAVRTHLREVLGPDVEVFTRCLQTLADRHPPAGIPPKNAEEKS